MGHARARAEQSAERRRAVDALRIAEGIAAYAARSLGNGLEPEEARRAALEAAAELEQVAASLRRLARPDPVADSAGAARGGPRAGRVGLARRAIAEQLGVTGETARRYLGRAVGDRGNAGMVGP